MMQKKNNKTLMIIAIAVFVIIVVIIAITNNNKEDKEIVEVKCPHCSRLVQELTEYHVCKNCYTYFMGLEVLKQQQQLTFFKSCYNEKGEKIK